MKISAIDKELLKHFILLNEPQKKSLLELIKSFSISSGEVSQAISIDQYNKELDEAMERINKGEFTTMEEMEKEISSW
jgi:hypothetical protein